MFFIALVVVFVSIAPSRLATAAPSGLVAAYGFDEGSGTTVTDQSGNGNNGTIANATWAATGKYGHALQFNGTNARINVPDAASLHLTTGLTLEAWVNPSTVNGAWRDVIYKGDDNYYLSATSCCSGRPAGGGIIGGSYGEAYGSVNLTTSTWAYLAVTYDGSNVRLYVNGTQVASTAHTGAISTSTNQLQIGGDSLYGQYFAGMIDEVRLYNTALTAAQIQTDMTTPITPTGPDTQPPTQPTGLTANAISGGEVDLSWTGSTDNVGVTNYLVERCLTSSCTFAQIGTTGNGTTHHLQGHHRRRRHRLQLPRPRHRRRRQPQPLLQHRHRHHPGAGHAAADAADRADRERDLGRRGRPVLDRLDRQRRRHQLPGRTLPQPRAAPSPRSAPPATAPAPPTRTPPSPPAPATATASAPPTPPPTSAPTPTPPPPPPRRRTRSRRRSRRG